MHERLEWIQREASEWPSSCRGQLVGHGYKETDGSHGGLHRSLQLMKLLVMVVIVNLYTITRLNITDCNIGGCGKTGTKGNK